MTDLEELREPYKTLISTIDISTLTMLEVSDKYNSEQDIYKKDIYAAILVDYCWPALEKLFYNQTVFILSLTDCYDIFMDAFFYVMEKQVWHDPENILYNDKDAILKAMYVVVESRRKNYFISQSRQKRVVNQSPLSLDILSEDFQEGYFSSITETYNFDRDWDKKFIKSIWEEQKYITAIIFDILLNANVIDENKINTKRIKKIIKHLTQNSYLQFMQKYSIIDNDLYVYKTYIQNINLDNLENYIINALVEFKHSEILKEIKNNNVD